MVGCLQVYCGMDNQTIAHTISGECLLHKHPVRTIAHNCSIHCQIYLEVFLFCIFFLVDSVTMGLKSNPTYLSFQNVWRYPNSILQSCRCSILPLEPEISTTSTPSTQVGFEDHQIPISCFSWGPNWSCLASAIFYSQICNNNNYHYHYYHY